MTGFMVVLGAVLLVLGAFVFTQQSSITGHALSRALLAAGLIAVLVSLMRCSS